MKNYLLVLLFGLCGLGFAKAQVPDTLVLGVLDTIRVGSNQTRDIHFEFREYVRSEALAHRQARFNITNFGANDLTPVLNHQPGVRVETRSPGSYRVLLRSTPRRSPFGVRDVRVSWNGLPLTEPGGDTPLNFLDLSNIDQASAVKGPFSHATGSPLGGSLTLSTLETHGLHASASLGSFGQKNVSLAYGTKEHGLNHIELRLSHRSADGYRDWSGFRRTTAQLSIRNLDYEYQSSKWNRRNAVHILATRLDYELPGALTAKQFADNPRQARPGSAETKAAIDYENILIGNTLEFWKSAWSLKATPYATGFRFDNPFNINHKRENNLGFGLRGEATYRSEPTKRVLMIGAESQFELRNARQYDANGGKPGDLQYSDDIYTRRLLGYASFRQDFLSHFYFHFASSANHLEYVLERTFERGGEASSAISDFELFFAPLAAIGYEQEKFGARAQLGRGSSTPTLREFRTNEGSINRQLKPEEGLSGELQAYITLKKSYYFSIATYYTQLSQSITTFQDSSQVQLFRNSGSTRQPGIELIGKWTLRDRGQQDVVLDKAKVQLAYSYQPYRYLDYEVGGVSFAGRPMPGLPEHSLDILTNAAFAKTFTVDVNLRYESRNPLNDAGTVEADAFWLLRTQIAWQRRHLRIFAAVDNVTDIPYSLGNDINPQFGNRYFQPAQGRGFVVGLNWFEPPFSQSE